MKSKIYTATGDRGTTSLVGGKRVAKDSARLEAYGTVDELNSHLGLLAAHVDDDALMRQIAFFQARLFSLGAYLATDGAEKINGLTSDDVRQIESFIDALDAHNPPLNSFILPGGTVPAAHAHVARTVCRRAERRVVALAASVNLDPLATAFLNRLSDWLFVAARFLNTIANVEDIPWRP